MKFSVAAIATVAAMLPAFAQAGRGKKDDGIGRFLYPIVEQADGCYEKCVESPKDKGDSVGIEDCNYELEQEWNLQEIGISNIVKVESRSSGYCLGVQSNCDGSPDGPQNDIKLVKCSDEEAEFFLYGGVILTSVFCGDGKFIRVDCAGGEIELSDSQQAIDDALAFLTSDELEARIKFGKKAAKARD